MSPHWNPAVEDQAIARAHRIGQTERVDVFRFIMEGFDDEEETSTLDAHSKAVQDTKEKQCGSLKAGSVKKKTMKTSSKISVKNTKQKKVILKMDLQLIKQ